MILPTMYDPKTPRFVLKGRRAISAKTKTVQRPGALLNVFVLEHRFFGGRRVRKGEYGTCTLTLNRIVRTWISTPHSRLLKLDNL